MLFLDILVITMFTSDGKVSDGHFYTLPNERKQFYPSKSLIQTIIYIIKKFLFLVYTIM